VHAWSLDAAPVRAAEPRPASAASSAPMCFAIVISNLYLLRLLVHRAHAISLVIKGTRRLDVSRNEFPRSAHNSIRSPSMSACSDDDTLIIDPQRTDADPGARPIWRKHCPHNMSPRAPHRRDGPRSLTKENRHFRTARCPASPGLRTASGGAFVCHLTDKSRASRRFPLVTQGLRRTLWPLAARAAVCGHTRASVHVHVRCARTART
jgi:hypothetical protein